jgi:hypothetical protein
MTESHVLVERGHVIVHVLVLGHLEALKLDRVCVVDKRGEQRMNVGRRSRILVLIEQRSLLFLAQLTVSCVLQKKIKGHFNKLSPNILPPQG